MSLKLVISCGLAITEIVKNTTTKHLLKRKINYSKSNRHVNLDGGNIYYVGSYGFNWSRTATSSTYAYYMYFTPGGIIPSSGYDRYRGNPLRRLSNPSDGTGCTVRASYGENMSKCTRFINVSGSEWKDTFRATDASGTLIAYDATNKTYDPHYLIGNYYQYNTATAGTGAAILPPRDSQSTQKIMTGRKLVP